MCVLVLDIGQNNVTHGLKHIFPCWRQRFC